MLTSIAVRVQIGTHENYMHYSVTCMHTCREAELAMALDLAMEGKSTSMLRRVHVSILSPIMSFYETAQQTHHYC